MHVIVIPVKTGIQNISIWKWNKVKTYYVYILANKRNGTLYIGVTNNLKGRIYQHKAGLYEGFTKKYSINKLVYFEMFGSIDYAITREKRLKKWNRKWKIELVEEKNPNWEDLFETL